jgi:hypothetical protein
MEKNTIRRDFGSIILNQSTREFFTDEEDSISSFKEPSICKENYNFLELKKMEPNIPSKNHYVFLEQLDINTHTNQKYIEKPFRIQKFLIDYFNGKKIEMQDLDFDIFELEIIYLFLINKFKKLKKLRHIRIDKKNETFFKKGILKIISIVSTQLSTKRREENNKFIYKFVLKILKSNFQNDSKNEIAFYQHYFADFAKSHQMTIEAFIDPLNKKGANSTINSDFLKRIFSVEKFAEDFKTILFNHFEDFYYSSIVTKIKKILKIYYHSINTETKSQTYSKFSNFISKKGIKFPWCINEIKNAIKQINQECLNFQKNSD